MTISLRVLGSHNLLIVIKLLSLKQLKMKIPDKLRPGNISVSTISDIWCLKCRLLSSDCFILIGSQNNLKNDLKLAHAAHAVF